MQDRGGEVPRVTGVRAGMEREGVEPDSVHSAAETVAFHWSQEPAIRGAISPPFQRWVHRGPFVGEAAYVKELL